MGIWLSRGILGSYPTLEVHVLRLQDNGKEVKGTDR